MKTDHIKFIDEYDRSHHPQDHVWHPTTKRELLRQKKKNQSIFGKVGETLSGTLKNVPIIGEQFEKSEYEKVKNEDLVSLEGTDFLKTLDAPHY